MSRHGVYLYGICRADAPRFPVAGGVGPRPSDVFFVQHRGVAAAVSRFGADRLVLTRDAPTHQRVLEALLEQGPVLPVSFGTVLESEGTVLTLLERREVQFTALLDEYENRVEAGVRVFWEKDAVISELRREISVLEPLRERAGSDPKAARQYSVLAGRAVADLVDRWKATYLPSIKAEMESWSIQAKYNDPIGVRMILNAAYLLERNRVGAFKSIVDELDGRYGARFRFRVTAPLPPHNFVLLVIPREDLGSAGGEEPWTCST